MALYRANTEKVSMARILKRRGRDKLYIIAQILEIAKDEALKTHIMYRANLSFKDVTAYLVFMLRISLLEKIEKDGKLVYKATQKGIVFLENYQGIMGLLKGDLEVEGKTTE